MKPGQGSGRGGREVNLGQADPDRPGGADPGRGVEPVEGPSLVLAPFEARVVNRPGADEQERGRQGHRQSPGPPPGRSEAIVDEVRSVTPKGRVEHDWPRCSRSGSARGSILTLAGGVKLDQLGGGPALAVEGGRGRRRRPCGGTGSRRRSPR